MEFSPINSLPLFVSWMEQDIISDDAPLMDRIYEVAKLIFQIALVVLESIGMAFATITVFPLLSDSFKAEWERIYDYFFGDRKVVKVNSNNDATKAINTDNDAANTNIKTDNDVTETMNFDNEVSDKQLKF